MSEDLQSVLKDYRDNERDIQMCQLAIEGNWSTVSYPRGLLVQCLEMRPLIAKKIIELGGQVPVEPNLASVIQERDQLRHRVTELETQISEQSELVQRDWLSPFEAAGLRDKVKRLEAAQTWIKDQLPPMMVVVEVLTADGDIRSDLLNEDGRTWLSGNDIAYWRHVEIPGDWREENIWS
jgi:hypothetical protein